MQGGPIQRDRKEMQRGNMEKGGSARKMKQKDGGGGGLSERKR